MYRTLRRLLHRSGDSERGMALPLVIMSFVSLCGAVALSADVGSFAATRRQLQNAADAAARAGATKLPGDPAAARTLAVAQAQKNGVSLTEVATPIVSTTTATDDTIRVTITRSKPYSFGKVLGLSSATISAESTMKMAVVVGAKVTDEGGGGGLFPYAVWGGNANPTVPTEVKPGDKVTYRSNNWAAKNVQPITGCRNGSRNNCNWDITGNDFKGYFHWKDSYIYLDWETKQAVNQGGNAMGTQPVAQLVAAQQAGTPVWLPLVDQADNSGGTGLSFRIPNFLCVLLDPIDTSGSSDWTGEVLDPAVDTRCVKSVGVRTGGGKAPPATYKRLYTPQTIE